MWSNEEDDAEEDRRSFGFARIKRMARTLLLEVVKMKADPGGFILVPGNRQPIFFWGSFSTVFNSEISPKDRKSVASYLKGELAKMDTRSVNEKPEVGYFVLTVHDQQIVFIVQTRPTPLGEELMVRLTSITDPTIPGWVKDGKLRDPDKDGSEQ